MAAAAGADRAAARSAGRLLHASSLRREARRVSSAAPLGPFALLQWTERSDEDAPLRDEFADLLAKINKLEDAYLTVEIASGVEIRVQRSAVVQVLPKGTIK